LPGEEIFSKLVLRPRTLHARKPAMSRKLKLTFACGDYEIMRALKEGSVQPEGIELTVLTDMGAAPRHWRFFRRREFDIAEVSAAGYIAARDSGLPFRAMPVFPHRRFRHGFIFVNTGKGIAKPTDLIGRRVGTKGFLFTAGVWMRGILEHDYGVPHRSISWLSEREDDVDFTPPPGLDLAQLDEGASLEEMLATGEIDALLSPDLLRPLAAGDPRVGRLFPDYKQEEIAFYRRTGIFPIMHVVGLRQELVERHPWWRSTCTRRSRRRGSWPCSGWRTRASSPWPGTARRGRSRSASWARTPGNTGWARAMRATSSGWWPMPASMASSAGASLSPSSSSTSRKAAIGTSIGFERGRPPAARPCVVL
jgi:4,5-dihydroxyphthalate decarboxylase